MICLPFPYQIRLTLSRFNHGPVLLFQPLALAPKFMIYLPFLWKFIIFILHHQLYTKNTHLTLLCKKNTYLTRAKLWTRTASSFYCAWPNYLTSSLSLSPTPALSSTIPFLARISTSTTKIQCSEKVILCIFTFFSADYLIYVTKAVSLLHI